MRLTFVKLRISPLYMSDETLYLQAAEEIKNGKMNPAIAAKAFAKGEGEENKTRAAYMELRVQQLKREAAGETPMQIALNTREGVKALTITVLKSLGYAIFVFLGLYALIRALSRL
jgi:hypothetical protein